ncbi:MAG: divergent PAP2 family protein [Oscillibacter sp.]|jgi:acid phosphatase family membrane protein YuiD|nr:divergent PAP2 family protein [Oscillibacter sp.]
MQISDLLQNKLVVNSLAAWAAAQIIKTIIYAIAHKELDWERLFGDGGMPSGHSATVTALAVTAAVEYGLSSGIFAVAAILAIVVMHDAMGVRLEAGKHAKALNALMDLVSSDLSPDDKLKELLGHTPLQVCFGALLGLVVALVL